jgi:hypothetical protein
MRPEFVGKTHVSCCVKYPGGRSLLKHKSSPCNYNMEDHQTACTRTTVKEIPHVSSKNFLTCATISCSGRYVPLKPGVSTRTIPALNGQEKELTCPVHEFNEWPTGAKVCPIAVLIN